MLSYAKLDSEIYARETIQKVQAEIETEHNRTQRRKLVTFAMVMTGLMMVAFLTLTSETWLPAVNEMLQDWGWARYQVLPF